MRMHFQLHRPCCITMLWFRSKMFPQILCVWKVTGSWWYYTQRWIHPLMNSVPECTLGNGAWLKVGHRGHDLVGCILVPGSSFLSLPSGCQSMSSCPQLRLLYHVLEPCFCLAASSPMTETLSQNNLFSFKSQVSGILSQRQQNDLRHTIKSVFLSHTN